MPKPYNEDLRTVLECAARHAIQSCKDRGMSMTRVDTKSLLPDRLETPENAWYCHYADDAMRPAFCVVVEWEERAFSIRVVFED